MFHNFNKITRIIILEIFALALCLIGYLYFNAVKTDITNYNQLIHYINPNYNDLYNIQILNFELIKSIVFYCFIPFNILIIFNELKPNIINISTFLVMVLAMFLCSIILKVEMITHTNFVNATLNHYLKNLCNSNNGCRKIPNTNPSDTDKIYSLNSVSEQIKRLLPSDAMIKVKPLSSINLSESASLYKFEVSYEGYARGVYNTFKNPSPIIFNINRDDKINFIVYKNNGFCSLYLDSLYINNQNKESKIIKFSDVLYKLEIENKFNNSFSSSQYDLINKELLTKEVTCKRFGV